MASLNNTVEIECKLEKEKANLALLHTRVENYQDLTKSMSTILNSFEQRLGRLEQTVLPVYHETEHLQKRQQNLDATLQCLESVLMHYDASQEVCNLIHLGPNEGDVATFLDALDRLKAAKDYFLNNNSQSVELDNVTSLFNTGCESLNNHFKALLRKHCSPMKPVDLLDLIYIEEDSSNEDCPSIKQLPPTAREELKIVAAWLENNLRREYVGIYADERSDVVFRSLAMLKDHQKSGSWGSEPLKVRYHGKPEPRKSTSARLQQIFERKANKMLLKASQTIEQSRFAIRKNSAYGDNLTTDDHVGDGDQDLEKYLVLLLGLQRLLIWERQILADVIPSSRLGEVFSRLASTSIEMVVKDAESITTKVLRSIARKDWTAALGVFSALKHVILMQPDIEKLCDTSQRHQLAMVLQKLQSTGAKALEQFLDLVRGDTGTNLVAMSSSTISGSGNVPRDATVHELTSNSIWFVEHLYEHADVIGGILQTDSFYASQLDSIALHKSLSPEDRRRALLGLYIKRILSELNLTIVSKCEQYSDVATRHLFRLNNIHYILKSLQRSNLLELLSVTEPECEKNYQDLIQDLKNSYQRSWQRILAHISPLEDLPRPAAGKVRDKERAVIKERFANFNKDLEEAWKTQRGISVPDVILREGLKRDNSETLIPQYNAFFETFADVQFSKNPEKYVKYKPQDVTRMLNSLFDDTV
ncbi:exocyst complex component 7 [Phlebotomus argentipes]|uniref:exocyst complex component 7 n=1 Tax=Phlebotomus argentipes TaxID=94469 RepID=UPI002892C1BB|nr:exocyst complex component 7 [Phlebotomus argentipes]